MQNKVNLNLTYHRKCQFTISNKTRSPRSNCTLTIASHTTKTPNCKCLVRSHVPHNGTARHPVRGKGKNDVNRTTGLFYLSEDQRKILCAFDFQSGECEDSTDCSVSWFKHSILPRKCQTNSALFLLIHTDCCFLLLHVLCWCNLHPSFPYFYNTNFVLYASSSLH